ncbi:hypothetical protein [Burkholderia stagnalis]|uniref:hypothetical protein n=1 Tax=Burkholderia stagnalis TaxID=1503054 RepID=UPI000755996D|nr:hypothetical protein WT05_20495 [Burkholderia stagnalis]
MSIWPGWVSPCDAARRTQSAASGPREWYLRAKKWVDRAAAGAISALGLRLILTAPKAGI